MCSIHPGYPSEDDVLQSAVDFTRAQGMVPLKYDEASESWVDDIAMSLGYVNASPKLQKPVDKFKYRYLVSSPNTVFTPACVGVVCCSMGGNLQGCCVAVVAAAG